MADQFIAEIRIFPFNFAPKGWAFCNGQLLPISQNTALFSLLGTYYGGDGKSTFGIPDMQGSAPMHTGLGNGPGLSQHFLGEASGSETVTLLNTEMPMHTHNVVGATIDNADSNVPTNNNIGKATTKVFNTVGTQVVMNPTTIGVTGGSLPHNNMMPYLTMNFCIAMQGIYPPRP
ncbi:MAG: tail fiber protein [Arcicella sp.]|nr:tail fiber protein [Arcicella sp.]